MAKHLLPPDRLAAFNAFVWTQMGSLKTSAWRDILDPHTASGAAVRAYYAQLLAAGEDVLDLVPPEARD